MIFYHYYTSDPLQVWNFLAKLSTVLGIPIRTCILFPVLYFVKGKNFIEVGAGSVITNIFVLMCTSYVQYKYMNKFIGQQMSLIYTWVATLIRSSYFF